MAEFLRKTMLYLGLVDGAEEGEHYYEDEHEQAATVTQHPSQRGGAQLRPAVDAYSAGPSSRTAVLDVPAQQISTVHPRSYNDAKQIGELLREGTPVIMNLSDLEDDLARRLVDFGAGLAFGVFGTIEKVTNRVFLLSPSTVQVSAEDKARIAQSGFYNQS